MGRVLMVLVLTVGIAGCIASVESTGGATCADVVDVRSSRAADGTITFEVTVQSADEGWDKYADYWEIRAEDGTVLATRELEHPHVDEQPFTRSLSGVVIPDDAGAITIAAHDSVAGFCGAFVTLGG